MAEPQPAGGPLPGTREQGFPMPGDGLVVGDDGLRRCAWGASTPDYQVYHDTEWGRPVRGETPLYERFTLEAFQSGLSWLTILRRRAGFRAAFAGFDAERVARFDQQDIDLLLADPGIVRNRAKVLAAIGNARAVLDLREQVDGGLDALVWSFAPPRAGRVAPQLPSDLRSSTAESAALSRALKLHGFVFVGPITAHAAMQACGLVDDHLTGCHARGTA